MKSTEGKATQRIERTVRWFTRRRLLDREVAEACARVTDTSTTTHLYEYLAEIRWSMRSAKFDANETRAICEDLSTYVARMLVPTDRSPPEPTSRKRGRGRRSHSDGAFFTMAKSIKRRVAAHEKSLAGLFKEVLAIADMFARAQRAHSEARKKTPESIPASFVKTMADVLGKSESYVEKYLRLSRIDPERRELLEAHPRIAGDLTAVLDVARASDTESAAELVRAYETGGRSAYNAVVESNAALGTAMKADPGFRMLARQFVDPRQALGGIAPTLPPPAELAAKHPVLAKYDTIGDLRRAIIAVGHKSSARRPSCSTGDAEPEKVARLMELADGDPQLTQAFCEYLVRGSRKQWPDSQDAPKTLFLEEGQRAVELPPFTTLGELRATARAAGFTKLADAEDKDTRKHHQLGVAGSLVRLLVDVDQRVSMRCGEHYLHVRKVIIERSVLEKALADTSERGADNQSASRRAHPPIDKAIILLSIH